ncbi:hypothetical protein M434DRAFT_67242 [Hypoxylon sp. CO27-5]|nr:hypothetical protein M434DRAFT_67242 [Hypoxylon sp. CO27-5]
MCSFCSATPMDQARSNYDSTVKLFYVSGNHGIWSLGAERILKEYAAGPRSHEVDNLRFLEKRITIPIPKVESEWVDQETGKYFSITSRIEGVTLDKLWIVLSEEEKRCIAMQVAGCLEQFRRLTFDSEGPVNFDSVEEHILTDEKTWEISSASLRNVSEEVREMLRVNMPSSYPYTFTHGDLAIHNIVVKDRRFAGLIGFESSRYRPVWFESVRLASATWGDDREWKGLLAEYMPKFPQAQRFCAAYWSLSTAPNSPDAMQALKELVEGAEK